MFRPENSRKQLQEAKTDSNEWSNQKKRNLRNMCPM